MEKIGSRMTKKKKERKERKNKIGALTLLNF